jgi:LuxR family maltose regulon positive regulatory protein
MPNGVGGDADSGSIMGGPLAIPAAKVRPPEARDGELPRSGVLEQILASDPRVLVVCAPAGFGKTTFVAQAVRLGERRVAWASLDSTDSDPVVLISTLLAALRSSGAAISQFTGVLTGDEPAFSRHVLTEFRCIVEAIDEPVTVVIDDLHLALDSRTRAIVTGLVDSLPQDCRVALVSRVEPDLPLALWGSTGEVELVSQEDLAFDSSEVEAMLATVTGRVPTSSETLSCLSRTGGWPVAAYLEATFGPHAGNSPVTATNLSAYLDGEVLARVPGDLAEFLRDTSILTLLDGPSCDAVLDASGSHQQLVRAAGSTLLVSPVREVSGAFRLHPLIREYLTEQLRKQDPKRAAELHSRAAMWCAESGFADEAIRHAFRSEDAHLIGRLVWAAAQPALAYGRVTRVEAWMELVDEQTVLISPELCMAAAWTAVASGNTAQVVRWATATAELLGPDWPQHLSRSTVEPSLALLLAVQGTGGYQAAAETARAARTALPISSSIRPLCRLAEGWCQALSGDVASGSLAMGEALSLAQAMELGTTWVEAGSLLAFVQAATGEWAAADLHIGTARHAWTANDLEGFATSTAILMTVSAWLHARDGRLDDAQLDLHRAESRLDQVVPTLPWLAPMSQAIIARTELLLDHPEAAARALDRAAATLAAQPDSPLLDDFISATRRDLEQRTPLAHLTPAERRVWDLLAQGLSRHEIAQALFVSDDTVKSHLSAIYRKVGVTNRREAIRLAADVATGTHQAVPGGGR